MVLLPKTVNLLNTQFRRNVLNIFRLSTLKNECSLKKYTLKKLQLSITKSIVFKLFVITVIIITTRFSLHAQLKQDCGNICNKLKDNSFERKCWHCHKSLILF